ncbi:hypothetical protein C2S51_013470 [Perilla frutescens var. frutescens]|nr:hypothetical protein C2S51_013470 [Perilla frutescens var. frutescens]
MNLFPPANILTEERMNPSSNERWIKHYSSSHNILLVGEGDFSFSLCLGMTFGCATNIVATTLDSYDELISKYKHAKANLVVLRNLGASVLHGVDATNMWSVPDLRCRKFHRIIYNFPHAGFSGNEADPSIVMMHRDLVRRFLQNASAMLNDVGEIHVNHKVTAPFDSWRVEDLGSECSLVCIAQDEFSIGDYPGYHNKRGSGSRADEPFPLGDCKTFRFRLHPVAVNNLIMRKLDLIQTAPQMFSTLDAVVQQQPPTTHFTSQTMFSPSPSPPPYRPLTSYDDGAALQRYASDLVMDMAREYRAVSPETYIVEEPRQVSGTGGTEADTQPSTTVEEEGHDSLKDVTGKDSDSSNSPPAQQTAPTTKRKKHRRKKAQGSGLSSQAPSEFNSTDPSVEPGVGSSTHAETGVSQILSTQEMPSQLVIMQNEMQKQTAMMVAASVTKEGKQLEAALGGSLEKAVKANSDALQAHLQEENAKQEKAAKECMQQLTNTVSNCLNKDLPAIIEKMVKREVAKIGQSVARTISPAIEKTISASIAESFQKGVGDKAVNQLEKSVSSKLEAVVARQIQSQFPTSGKQALQETVKSSLEASVVPAFEISCRTMIEQVNAAFQKGMVEHTSAAQQQFEASHSPLALALRVALDSASSVTQTMSNELLDGQRKLLAIAVSGANSKAPNLLMSQLSNGHLGALHEKVEVPPDPTKELCRLIAERKYDDALSAALQMSDANIVSWLCSQTKSGVGELRKIKHYSNRHRILLVGEGDFSFSACLAVALGSATNIIATSLNNTAFLKKNYGSALSNIEEVRSRGGKVMHGIDATEIAKHKFLRQLQFDRIVFNFPLAGIFPKSSPEFQLRQHERLVSLFLKNSKEMISENGEIHISHKTVGVHAEFNLESIASSHGLRLIAAVKFKCFNYPGYNTKCGFGGDKNFNCKLSKTFKFGLIKT